jgi:fatty-acyl-CoA synthase
MRPAILECAVIAVPDEKWGQIPKAIVAMKPDAQATEKELVDFCHERKAAFRSPKSIAFI